VHVGRIMDGWFGLGISEVVVVPRTSDAYRVIATDLWFLITIIVRHEVNSRMIGRRLQSTEDEIRTARIGSIRRGGIDLALGTKQRVHFTSVAALLFGTDPMPVNPKESRCLLRARVGLLMPEHRDHWWSVTSETDGDSMSEELATVCSSYVLPWLEQFKTLAHVDWKPRRGVMIQHRLAEAAANLVLGNRERAAQCIEAELVRIERDPAHSKWKEEQVSRTRAWAVEFGIPVS